MLKIGLTGGIGSGKSTVAAILQSLGAALIDTDAIARSLTAPGGAAMAPIQQAFGSEVVDAQGALDRAAMRERVFKDTQAKQRLESILHPMIGHVTRQQADAAMAAGATVVVFDVPLLVESATWRERVDRVLVVDCDEATQVRRVSTRPGWSVEAATRVVQQQATRAQRRAVADAVIANEGISLPALTQAVQALWAAWTQGTASS